MNFEDERRPPKIPTPDDLRAERVSEDLVLLSFPCRAPVVSDSLTAAEREIALLVHDGLSNEEIARARGVSVKTVNNQLEAIYRKLGLNSRIELVLVLQGIEPPR